MTGNSPPENPAEMEIGEGQGARTFLLVPEWNGQGLRRDLAARTAEAEGLALAIGLDVVGHKAFRIRQPRAATLMGKGQLADIVVEVTMEHAELVIVDASLSPIQQRNLETAMKCKVIDRTALILEIFGERAATAEGRMQVELAHLDYQAGRLVRSWTHLERQRGGFGFLGGPGETQIEADRRMIRDRMARIRRQLEEVKRTRQLQRRKRQRAPWPVVALVGYTNAGKSTLFNRLTGSDVMAADLLFATLDPTMRQISLPGIDKVILSDTVGFVSDLPTELVAAFRATLEEVLTADLIVHVRDIAHPETEAQRADVLDIMGSLGIGPKTAEGKGNEGEGEPPVPICELWNKADLLDADQRALLSGHDERRDDVAMLSALTGEGLDEALAMMTRLLTQANRVVQIELAAENGEALAWLYAHGEVVDVRYGDADVAVDVRLSDVVIARFNKKWGVVEDEPDW